MLKIKGKKGSDLMMMLLVDIVIISILIISMMQAINRYLSNSSYEARFISQDLGLMLDTIYASPNDLTIRYPQRTDKFTYEFTDDGKIFIYKEGKMLASRYFMPISTIYFENTTLEPDMESTKKVTFLNIDIYEKMGYVPIKFQKEDNNIKISKAINILGDISE